MKIKIKRLSPDAVVPAYSRLGDCGLDITATSMIETEMYIEYGTSIAIKLPENFVGLIYPRSSLSNYDLVLANHVGVIDSNYTGEIKFRFKRTKPETVLYEDIDGDMGSSPSGAKIYKIGDRIGQIIIQEIPSVEFEEVEELGETNRGTAGYGSSGK